MQSIATTETIQRARRAVQSAHLYYTESMNLLDTVCSPGRSGFMAALSDEQSKADTYKGAPTPFQARSITVLTQNVRQRRQRGPTKHTCACRSA